MSGIDASTTENRAVLGSSATRAAQPTPHASAHQMTMIRFIRDRAYNPAVPLVNHLGQPVGESLEQWVAPTPPSRAPLTGRYCRLEPLGVNHARALWYAYLLDTEHRSWTYLPHGPYPRFDQFERWVDEASATLDPLFFAILTSEPVGVAAYLRIAPGAGSIEVGHIHYSPLLQRTPAATEAMYLMMRQAFELGYRRYEWKCDALNAASCAAALRLGFTYEGTFRQATVYKGRNRDTAWYAVVDKDWPALKARFERWLDPSNFDDRGCQRTPLRS
jgi:RimJ/RimL family protein N-acetyltransferase